MLINVAERVSQISAQMLRWSIPATVHGISSLASIPLDLAQVLYPERAQESDL